MTTDMKAIVCAAQLVDKASGNALTGYEVRIETAVGYWTWGERRVTFLRCDAEDLAFVVVADDHHDAVWRALAINGEPDMEACRLEVFLPLPERG